MIQIDISEQRLELLYTWKIARSASDYKTNFFVRISDGKIQAIGEVAPNVRYGESSDLILAQFHALKSNALSQIRNHSELLSLFQQVSTCNSLRFGIESAFLNYWSAREGISVSQYLGIAPCAKVYTTFTMPIMPIGEMCAFYEAHHLQRFKSIKLKINAENGYDALKEISKVAKQHFMIDGNEAFLNPDDVLKYIDFLKDYPVLFLEQPMPAEQVNDYRYLKPKSDILIMGDESITDQPDMDAIATQFHGVNMKLQKAGGYVNGLRILNEARKRNLKTMIGCMVETSVGIASAMHLCDSVDFVDLDGFLILKEEPFGLAIENEGALVFQSPIVPKIS